MSDGRIVLEAELLTDNPMVAGEFRRRSYKDLGLAFDLESPPKAKGEPVRFYGWRAGLAVHDLFNKLSVERDGAVIKRGKKFYLSLPEITKIGEKCRLVLDAYKKSEKEGDKISEMLAPPPLGMTVALSGYRYDFSLYRDEIGKAVRLADILSGIPEADTAGYYYEWFTWA